MPDDDPNYLEIIKSDNEGWIVYKPWNGYQLSSSCMEVCQRCGCVIASAFVGNHDERCRPDEQPSQ